jgi:4-amino-4-deoxy-L-arabinose transferase-like glycosyltransferase
VIAFVLRSYQIGRSELWLDEAASHYYTTTEIRMGNAGFYYLLLRGWIHIAGQSEAALRLLSAIFGTLFIVGVMGFGRRILGRWAGVWAGAFAAVSPIHIYYSQEARSYSLVLCVLLLVYLMLWRALETDEWRYWALFSTCAVVALYSHVFAILGMVPTVFLLLFGPGQQGGIRRWLHYGGSVLLCAVLFLPWVLGGRSLDSGAKAGSAWIREVWELTPPLLAIPLSLEVFGLGGQVDLVPIQMKQFTLLEFPSSLRVLGLGTLLLLGIWSAMPWGDRDFDVPELGKRKAWLMLCLFAPLGMLWLVSLRKPLYVVGRYDLMAFPAFALLVGLGLRKAQRVKTLGPVLAPFLAMMLLVPIGAKLFLYYQAPLLGDARTTAHVLNAGVREGDAVVFTGQRGLPVLYYLQRLGYRWSGGYCDNPSITRRFACRMFPRETERTPAVLDPSWIYKSADAVRENVQDLMKAVRPRTGELWVAFERFGPPQGPLVLSVIDKLFERELRREGLAPVEVQGASDLFRFRRPADA